MQRIESYKKLSFFMYELKKTEKALSAQARKIVPVLEKILPQLAGLEKQLIEDALTHYGVLANNIDPWTEIPEDLLPEKMDGFLPDEAKVQRILSALNQTLETKNPAVTERATSCCWITLHFTRLQDVLEKQKIEKSDRTILNDCLSAPMQRLPRWAMITLEWHKIAAGIPELANLTEGINRKFRCIATASNQLMKASEAEQEKLDSEQSYLMNWGRYLIGAKPPQADFNLTVKAVTSAVAYALAPKTEELLDDKGIEELEKSVAELAQSRILPPSPVREKDSQSEDESKSIQEEELIQIREERDELSKQVSELRLKNAAAKLDAKKQLKALQLEAEAALQVKEDKITALNRELTPLPGIIVMEQKKRTLAEEEIARLKREATTEKEKANEEIAKLKREAFAQKQKIAEENEQKKLAEQQRLAEEQKRIESDPLLKLSKRAEEIDDEVNHELKVALQALCTDEDIATDAGAQICQHTHTMLDVLFDSTKNEDEQFNAIQIYKQNCAEFATFSRIGKLIAAVVIAAVTTVVFAAVFAVLGGMVGSLAAGPVGGLVGFFAGAILGTVVGLDVGIELGSAITGITKDDIRQFSIFGHQSHALAKQAREVAKVASKTIQFNM